MDSRPSESVQPTEMNTPEAGGWAAELAWLEKTGLAGPAHILLQTLLPATFLLGQGVLFLQPLLPLQRWRWAAGRLSALLSDRAKVEAFLSALEAHLGGSPQHKEASR